MPARVRRVTIGLTLVALAGAVAFVALRERIQHLLVGVFTPDYVAPPAQAKTKSKLRLAPVATGFEKPTDIQFVPGERHIAVVLEKGGRARLADLSGRETGTPGATVFAIDVETNSELGLLGMAFHPKYRENGRFYVNYNPKDGASRTVVSEWRLLRAELGAQRAKEVRKILEVPQPYPNHNAGQLVFGPDGFLYVGLGDGGWKNDPHGNGQDLSTLLGAMLRLDVDVSGVPFGIPKDNPFIARQGARPEIWAYGLRNPWRYTFDPRGRMIVADVGQDSFEEIDIVAKGDNLGWNVREGLHCFEPKDGCSSAGLVDPIFEYGRELGTSVTGGYVYTGDSIPALAGRYVFGDFTSGRVWALTLPSAHLASREPAKAEVLGVYPLLISTFGRDEEGELYVGDYAAGGIYRLALQ